MLNTFSGRFGEPLKTGAAANRFKTNPGIGFERARIVDMHRQQGRADAFCLHTPH